LLLDVARALPAALVAVVLPGYFWAVFLRPAGDLAERLAYSTVLSMASVPVLALVLARLSGTGVTLWIAIVSVALVLGSWALAVAARGRAPGPAEPILPVPVIRDGRVLGLIALALALAVIVIADRRPPGALLVVIAAALLAAGALSAWQARPAGQAGVDGRASGRQAEGEHAAQGTDPEPEPERDTQRAPAKVPASGFLPSRMRVPALVIVLGLTAVRGYYAVIRYDWPSIRGSDMFSHAVMAEQMLSHGSYGTYLVYPPGFSTLTAVVCRLCGLTPLELFPVLAPTLLLVSALGAYALATRLWGWECGVAAAALSGVVLIGAYAGFAEGRYPDLVSAYFLITMAVAALLTLYESPSLRSGALLAVVGPSAVFYHSVATLYLAVVLAVVAVIALPYLLWRRRGADARVLFLGLVCVGVLSACYALVTYGLPKDLGGKASATSTAVSIVLGSQTAPSPEHILSELSPPIVWLGAFGVAMLLVGVRYLRTTPQVLAAATMLLWTAIMYAGSRTTVDGFPQRFERDVGAPLSVIGAFGLTVILVSLLSMRARDRAQHGTTELLVASAAAAAVVAVLLLAQTVINFKDDSKPARDVVSPSVAAAGAWLARHNDGSGTIISTPYMNHGITNRAVLAMGGYAGLQSYQPYRIAHPRSLPPAGRKPLLDSQQVLLHPATCASASILVDQDVQYVVLYKAGTGADLAAFRADRSRYREVFDNSSVVIYRPARARCTAG
jgi:hypothetical protein